MAADTHKPSPAHCPVAALAYEAERLIDAYSALDGESFVKRHDLEARIFIDGLETANRDRLAGIEEWASYLQTRSDVGAKFQLCVAHRFLTDMRNECDEKERERLIKKIERVFYSLSAYFENNHGIDMDDVCADYYMRRNLSPHFKVEEGLSRLDRARVAAE